MEQKFLSRYERSDDGRILLDVAAAGVEALYSDWDKSSPYIRRDLDQDLVDYLIECAREVGREDFAIRFTLADPPDEWKLARIRRSVTVYFQYLAETGRQKIRQMVRRSVVFAGIGLFILFLSVWVNTWLGPEPSVAANVFAQGLTVAAWVSLWEALASFLVDWFPHRKDIRLYGRLAGARLIFRPKPPGEGFVLLGPAGNAS